jgi:histidine triad (HIT) family protein
VACIFCDIIDSKIPSNKIYEDEKVVAFEDIDPKAPVHILVVPKEHISTLDDITKENCGVISHVYLVIKELAAKYGLEDGYRVISNCKENGGQTVFHIHFHLLGGKTMTGF